MALSSTSLKGEVFVANKKKNIWITYIASEKSSTNTTLVKNPCWWIASIDNIVNLLPPEWNILSAIIQEKLEELCREDWKTDVWNNFIECLNENTENE